MVEEILIEIKNIGLLPRLFRTLKRYGFDSGIVGYWDNPKKIKKYRSAENLMRLYQRRNGILIHLKTSSKTVTYADKSVESIYNVKPISVKQLERFLSGNQRT